jgi:hypothetical protein
MNNNDITIARRFNNLLEAVTELNVDISYNLSEAIRSIKHIQNDRSLRLTTVFVDQNNEIWYVIRSVREGLNLLHKYAPFHACLSDAPFNVYRALNCGDDATLETANKLIFIGRARKCDGARKEIAKKGLIAG